MLKTEPWLLGLVSDELLATEHVIDLVERVETVAAWYSRNPSSDHSRSLGECERNKLTQFDREV